MRVEYGTPRDIEAWMALVKEVRWNFPGLETQEKLDEHRDTVLKFMDKQQAICVKEGNQIAGVMLFSKKHNMIMLSCRLARPSAALRCFHADGGSSPSFGQDERNIGVHFPG